MKSRVLRAHDWVLAIVFVAFIVYLFLQFSHRDLVADDLMVINKVHIPDFVVGEDPPTVYDRTVFKEFEAHWEVRVYSVGEKTTTAPVMVSLPIYP